MSTENATTQEVHSAVPAQQTININTDTITLKAREIYAQMSQFGENAKAYGASTSMAGETYFTFKCKGAMINVPPSFQEAFTERKLYSITITGRPYNRTVADPNVAGGTKIQLEQSWTYDSFMTIETYKETMMNEAEINKLEAALEMQNNEVIAVAKAAKNVKVSTEREKELMTELQLLIA